MLTSKSAPIIKFLNLLTADQGLRSLFPRIPNSIDDIIGRSGRLLCLPMPDAGKSIIQGFLELRVQELATITSAKLMSSYANCKVSCVTINCEVKVLTCDD